MYSVLVGRQPLWVCPCGRRMTCTSRPNRIRGRRWMDAKPVIATIILATVALRVSWMHTHLFARPMSAFSWPPHINVSSQVYRELSGLPSEYVYENDWQQDGRLAVPDCGPEWTGSQTVLIVVKSAERNVQNRDAIRSTWGRPKEHKGWRICVVFVTASMSRTSLVFHEHNAYHDMLIPEMNDTYRTNTYKFAQSLWLSQEGLPSSPNFTLLLDDDYLLNMDGLVDLLYKRMNEREPLYEGFRFDTSPFRFRLHKHAVSYWQYPFAEYPPYISAGAVLLNAEAVSLFFHASRHLRVYLMDDVYAGIIALLMHIDARHNPSFAFWERSISPSEWSSFIAIHGYSCDRLVSEYTRLMAPH